MKTSFIKYSALIISIQALLLGACLRKQELNQRASAAKSLSSDDQSASLAQDTGCSDYFANGKDESLEASDITGQAHPLCSVLTESRAQYLIVVPAYNDCASCETYAMDLAAQSVAQGYGGAVKIALLLSNQNAALSLGANYKWNFSDSLVFVDGKSAVLDRISKLGFASGDEKLYAINKTSGAIISYASKPKFEDLAKALNIQKLEESDSSNDINILVNWDGLTNIGEDGWNVNEVK